MAIFPVLSDEELEAQRNAGLEERRAELKEGVPYQFTVIKAQDWVAKETGNASLKLTLQVFDEVGNSRLIDKYLSLLPQMAWQRKQFWESVGEPQLYYEAENPDHLFLNRSGTLEIKIEKSKDPRYKDKPVVKNFLTTHAVKMKQTPSQPSEPIDDDDIPF